jgi:type II secretory pathway pseudopilin PulG
MNDRTTIVAPSKSRASRWRLANPRAAGFTLLEVVIAVSMASAVMGGAAVLLQGVWRVERSTRHHAQNLAADYRLAETFRSDAHHAHADALQQLAQVEGADKLVLALEDGRLVEYSAGPAQVERVVKRGDEIAGRDTFLLKPNSTVRWQAGAEDAPMISMLVSAPLGLEQLELAEIRTTRTDALVGKWSTQSPRGKE